MHGLIFASFRDYLVTEHGVDVAKDVTVGEPQYTLSEAYPDEQFLAGLPADLARAVREKLPPRVAPKPAEVTGMLPRLRKDWGSTRLLFALGPQGLEWSSDPANNPIDVGDPTVEPVVDERPGAIPFDAAGSVAVGVVSAG